MPTGGQLNATANAGTPDLLREAEEKLRATEDAQRQAAETQAAILDALPASVALIDREGVIVAANESWRRLGTANLLQGSTSASDRTTSTHASALEVTVPSRRARPASGSGGCWMARPAISASTIRATPRRSSAGST